MDAINIMIHLFLAVLPVFPNLIPVSLAQVIHWTPQVTWAYADLGRWFALTHRFITTGIVATVSAHAVYEVWSHVAHSGEAPLILGIVVVAGYMISFTGLIRAWNRERHCASQYQ